MANVGFDMEILAKALRRACAMRRRVALEVFVERVSEAGETSDARREEECGVLEVRVADSTDDASTDKTKQEDHVEQHAEAINRVAAQRLAEGDAEVCHDAGHVCAANHGATVARRHGVLQAAGDGCEVVTDGRAVSQKPHGCEEQRRL